jgi:hypothetical protein
MGDMIPKTIFFAKTWFYYVGAILCTMLALFCVIMGPLFLFGVMKRADGQPGTDAGSAMSIIAVPMSELAILGWFNVIARRKPLLRICCDGIEINVIGSSSLDGVPLIPSIIRIAWLLVSLEGFKKQIGWIPWSMLRGVEVNGLPMVRSMVIDGTIAYPNIVGGTARIGNTIAFRDAEFVESLDGIASAIRTFHANLEARESLPSLRG